MSADLKEGERHGSTYDFPTRIPNAVFQSWDGSLQTREKTG